MRAPALTVHPSPGASLNAAQRLFVALQHVLPQHALSHLMHAVARIRLTPVKNALIGTFVARYHPDLQEAADPNPFRYPCFNAFFTRALHPAARPIDLHPGVVGSPVDGTVSQIGRIEGSSLLQAKGHTYTLAALLAAPEWEARFAGGSFVTLYLAPRDYHRIHMPLAGTLRAAWYIPGRLFSVNTVTQAAVPGLFARNERICCVLEQGSLVFALVLVGALLVGSMSTVWHGDITPRRTSGRMPLPLTDERVSLSLPKGAQLGRFNMGSTVILLLPPGAAEWLPELTPGTAVRMGQPLAHLAGVSG